MYSNLYLRDHCCVVIDGIIIYFQRFIVTNVFVQYVHWHLELVCAARHNDHVRLTTYVCDMVQ